MDDKNTAFTNTNHSSDDKSLKSDVVEISDDEDNSHQNTKKTKSNQPRLFSWLVSKSKREKQCMPQVSINLKRKHIGSSDDEEPSRVVDCINLTDDKSNSLNSSKNQQSLMNNHTDKRGMNKNPRMKEHEDSHINSIELSTESSSDSEFTQDKRYLETGYNTNTIHANKKQKTNFFEEIKSRIDIKNDNKEELVDPEKCELQHDITISGVKVQLPVSPYPCQKALMNALIQGCTKEQNCLLESPTGSGKTLALLCGVLAWQNHFIKSHKLDEKPTQGQQPKKFYDGSSEDASDDESCSKKGTKDCKTDEEFSDFFDDDESEGKKKSRIPKIYYGTRTHRQISQIIKELRKTAYRNTRMTVLSSREISCIQDTNRSKTELCKELLDPTVANRNCQFHNENARKRISSHKALETLDIENPWTTDDLVALGKQECACPYFAARDLMLNADIIFCPYNYIIDPFIRESMNIELKGDIVILDEAHNIEDICRNSASMDFKENELEEIIEECKKLHTMDERIYEYKVIIEFLSSIIRWMKNIKLQPQGQNDEMKSSYWSGSELMELFDINNLTASKCEQFRFACLKLIALSNEVKENLKKGIISKKDAALTISDSSAKHLECMIYSFSLFGNEQYVDDFKICVVTETVNITRVEDNTWYNARKDKKRVLSLKIMCLNSAVVFKPLSDSVRSIILASGTLAPTNTFKSELGVPFPHMLSANHVIPKDQIYVRCIPKGPTGKVLRATYSNVNTWDFQDELGKLLINVCRSIPHGALCFFSSYTVLNKHMERWFSNGMWVEMSKYKVVYVEPRNGNELSSMMSAFKEEARKISGLQNGALLMAVFRGKVAEGIDFSDEDARCVITVGIPYPVKLDPVIEMKMNYNDKYSKSKGLLTGSEWYTTQAFRALNQALGRCVRHINDWGAVLLVDQRFMDNSSIQNLPKWVKAMYRQNIIYDLEGDLKEFVEQQNKREWCQDLNV